MGGVIPGRPRFSEEGYVGIMVHSAQYLVSVRFFALLCVRSYYDLKVKVGCGKKRGGRHCYYVEKFSLIRRETYSLANVIHHLEPTILQFYPRGLQEDSDDEVCISSQGCFVIEG